MKRVRVAREQGSEESKGHKGVKREEEQGSKISFFSKKGDKGVKREEG